MPQQPQPLSVILDFDGTITLKDVGDLVVTEFAHGDWRVPSAAYDRGEISLRELWAAEIAHLRKADHDAMRRRAVEAAEVRPGLAELLDFCRERDINIEVASSGITFYIEAILEQEGETDIIVAAPGIDYDERGHGVVTFEEGLIDCGMTAMCKCERVWAQRRLSRQVVFVGDGASDYCAALQADHVMARDALARYCEREGREFTRFDDFFEVRERVAMLTGG